MTVHSSLIRAVKHPLALQLRRLVSPSDTLPDPRNTIALTFDDGPDPIFTSQVLEVLAQLDVPATFFLVGRSAIVHPKLVRRILDEGHGIGSHSFSHPDPAVTSPVRLTVDYRNGRKAVESVAEAHVPLFRPPHGHLDHWGSAAIWCCRAHPWLWSHDTGDYLPGITSDQIAQSTRDAGPGAVILLHDGLEEPLDPECLDRSATVGSLRGIVASARAKGLEFTKLPCPDC